VLRSSTPSHRPLAVDAEGRPGERLQPFGRNGFAALRAAPERTRVDAGERGVDLLEVLNGPVAEREVALLLEDLGRGRGLRPVRHLAGRDDDLGKFRAQALPLGEQGRSGGLDGLWHRAIVRLRRVLAGGGLSSAVMATEIDPVCGMEVDITTSQLKLEHDGKTYWFCGRGCLLEFRDDPDKYLDPDYVPSM
jgi:YHS domain-containing protein